MTCWTYLGTVNQQIAVARGFVIAFSSATLLVMPVCFAQDESRIKAVVQSDGALVLKGTANVFDLAFGGSDSGFTNDGPLGIRSVTFGEHLYIKGESNKELLQQQQDRGGDNLYIEPGGISKEDRREKGGWWAWYSKLARRLTECWKADVPGQMQVVLLARPDGSVEVMEQEAFVCGADNSNRIETPKTDPGLVERFRSEIDEAVHKLSINKLAVFPQGSTAKSVLLLATFVADHDLRVGIPDLKTFEELSQDPESVRIMRICSVLDSGFQFSLANKLRSALPMSLRHKFIPDGARHEFYSKSKDGFYSIDNGTTNRMPQLDSLEPFAARVLEEYVKMKDYAAAERFAKALVSQVSISDEDQRRTRKLIADHLLFLRLQSEADQLLGTSN